MAFTPRQESLSSQWSYHGPMPQQSGAYQCLIASTPIRLRPAKRRSSILTEIFASCVRCAVTGTPIPLEELKYWSVERQEAYANPRAVLQRLFPARAG